jgi:carbon monoxide dehydrogenase subunit G
MKFEGHVEIHAPRAKVWAFLTDPDQIASCGPGVESIEKLDDGRFQAHGRVGVGFITTKFVVNAEFSEVHEPDDATVVVHGQASGTTVDATARMVLTDGPDGATVIDWFADVAIAGTLAGVAARMIDGSANKMVGQTFDCVKAKLEA